MKKIITLFHGFCMALADSVPGVSGGTVAFLMGFYDDFVGSLNGLISGPKEKRISALKYLIKLGIGWVAGFCLAVLLLAKVFESIQIMLHNPIIKISSSLCRMFPLFVRLGSSNALSASRNSSIFILLHYTTF